MERNSLVSVWGSLGTVGVADASERTVGPGSACSRAGQRNPLLARYMERTQSTHESAALTTEGGPFSARSAARPPVRHTGWSNDRVGFGWRRRAQQSPRGEPSDGPFRRRLLKLVKTKSSMHLVLGPRRRISKHPGEGLDGFTLDLPPPALLVSSRSVIDV